MRLARPLAQRLLLGKRRLLVVFGLPPLPSITELVFGLQPIHHRVTGVPCLAPLTEDR